MKSVKKMAAMAAAVCLLATGCANNGGNDSSSTADAGDNAPITLRFAWWGSDNRHEAMQAVAKLYEAKHANVKIQAEFGPNEGWQAKVMTWLSGKTEPDILQVNYNWVHSFGKGKNVFLDLNTVKDHIDLSNWDQEQLDAMTVDGQLAAVPHGITARANLYNTELFSKYKLDYPTTYADMIAAGGIIGKENTATGAENQYVLTNIGEVSTDLYIAQLLHNQTGKTMQTDGTVNYSAEQVKQVFDLYKSFEDSGALPTYQQDDPIDNESNPVWTSGRSGSVYEWIGTMDKYLLSFKGGEAKDKISVAPYIREKADDKVEVYVKPSLGFAISQNSKHAETAADFLNFMFTDEEAVKTLGTSLGISSNKVARKIQDEANMLEGAMKEGYELLATYDQVMLDPYFEDENVRGARYKAIEAFRSGAATSEEAAKQYVENQQKELDKLF